MNNLIPPFKFDLAQQVATVRRKLNNRVDGIELQFPFVSISVNPDDLEQQVAKEIIIRMANKRVLDGQECCDNCIDSALDSLQDIRAILVDKQVQLSKATDGPLYVALEFMLEGIRQFLTFEQRLKKQTSSRIVVSTIPDFRRPADQREQYFAALEMLRTHLKGCLSQIQKIADFSAPKATARAQYSEAWLMEAYKAPPELPGGG